MLENFINLFKYPTTTLLQKSEEEDIKKGAIRTLILSLIISILGVIGKVITITQTYSKMSKSSYYTKETIAQRKAEAFKDAELFGSFFKQFFIMIAVIAIIALVLFIIAKLVKSDKKYNQTLSMVSNAYVFVTLGCILQVIFNLIYLPLAILFIVATSIYATLTLIIAFRDSLDVEDSDKFVIITTAVLIVTVIIAYLVVSNIVKETVGSALGTEDLTSLMGLF